MTRSRLDGTRQDGLLLDHACGYSFWFEVFIEYSRDDGARFGYSVCWRCGNDRRRRSGLPVCGRDTADELDKCYKQQKL